jgi:Mn2+/Fe2+ NRAMP family transporter
MRGQFETKPGSSCRGRLKFRAPGKRTLVILPRKLLGLIYVAIGIFLAANKDYFQNLDTVKRVLSALLAVLLWPLLLLGVNLHIK